jgi:PIN domain nuclease of toxin-antitoxin system
LKTLLDTHAFLWFINGDARLSSQARMMIEAPANECLVSVVSLWEITIKVSLGKVRIPASIGPLVEIHVLGNGFRILPIRPEHLERLEALPFHHRDPFDRLLIAQGLEEEALIVTRDSAFGPYGAALAW